MESDQNVRVFVLESAGPEYFVPHVDLTKVAEYTAEAAKAENEMVTGEAPPPASDSGSSASPRMRPSLPASRC